MAIYSGFSHKKWWFSIAMLVYQRVHIWLVVTIHGRGHGQGMSGLFGLQTLWKNPGGYNPSWKIWKSMGRIIPYIIKIKKWSKPSTRYVNDGEWWLMFVHNGEFHDQ